MTDRILPDIEFAGYCRDQDLAPSLPWELPPDKFVDVNVGDVLYLCVKRRDDGTCKVTWVKLPKAEP